MSTGWVTDELLFWHDAGNGAHFVPSGPWVEPMPHADSPATKRRFWALVEGRRGRRGRGAPRAGSARMTDGNLNGFDLDAIGTLQGCIRTDPRAGPSAVPDTISRPVPITMHLR
jgi:hypothetical protein